MEMDGLISQNIFTKGILTLLSNNPGRSYTINELAETHHIVNGTAQIKKSIELLLKQSLVKVKSRGSELCYQVVPTQLK